MTDTSEWLNVRVTMTDTSDWLNVRVGCDFRYELDWPMETILQIKPRPDGQHRVLVEHLDTPALVRDYRDLHGNICQRLTLRPGAVHLRYDAIVAVPNRRDPVRPDAAQVSVHELPDEALVYTLPSRYCQSDLLSETAWQLFGTTPMGWRRVQAICGWVHDNLRFQYASSTAITSALDVYRSRVGVCRDFAHLAVAFCRAMSIPARYVFGYLPDIGVVPPDDPMDFCAWFEAYLDGQWYAFDPRNNEARIGRIVIGHGRDALDVAMVTSYGTGRMLDMTVRADQVPTASQPALTETSSGWIAH